LEPRVAVCIATYRRPNGLDRLLAGIARQRYSKFRPVVSVVVVDNHAEGQEAAPVVERWSDELGGITFVKEPRQGISFARNAALDAAPDCDFVALIDDDEAPVETWLESLLDTQHRYQADVVRGPVIADYENEPEDWIVKGKFFERPRYPTGTVLDIAFTHNVLFRWDPYGRDLRFSPKYAKSGGSDTHYFARIHEDGGRIVWCDEAEVIEWNPPARQTVKWLVRRQYRIGLVRAAIDAELGLHASPRRTTAQQAWNRVAAGALGLARSVRAPRHRQVKHLGKLASGLGRAAGLLGLWFEEYQ
jgi:glycosyltransferase involved in cell wall biosynthesis